jgi:DNA-binding NarL/FixJ family response regulator
MGASRMSGGRVLVVDDHDGFRSTARRLLEAEGWEVVGEAADGATAIAAAIDLRPDLVLLDIGLPDIDGFAVADRLAADGAPAIVLVSSRERAAYGHRLASSAAAGFISKGDLDGVGLRAILESAR